MSLLRLCHFLKSKNLFFQLRTIVNSPHPDINFKKETIAETAFTYCQKFSNRISFIDSARNVSYTFGDVERFIKSIASSLTKRCVQQGSMVSIIASNCPEYVMLQMALSSMGCSVVLCNPNYTTGEIVSQLTDTKSTILFTNEDVVEKVSQAASQVSVVKDIYLIENRKSGYKAVDDLMNDSGNMNPIGHVKIDLDNDVAMIIYSSGTTGFPKGVMLTHTNLVSSFHQTKRVLQIADEIIMMPLPLYHGIGINFSMFMTLYSGSTLVLQSKFDPITFFSAIEKYKASVLFLVPSLILILLNHPEVSKYDLSSVSKCFYAGAPIDTSTVARLTNKFKAYNRNFDAFQVYGLSEMTAGTHYMPFPRRLPGKEGSIGVLAPNIQCKVVDVLSREEVSVNVPGELLFRGPNTMKGYLGKPEETIKDFENNWLLSGDIGYYDQDNYFYIIDRIKELIKVNAFQVAPAELEKTLMALPGIVDCAVVGIPDAKYGEVPKAFVVKSRIVTKTEINDHMASHLTDYKQLKGGITFVDNIPRGPSGKILRRLLKTEMTFES